MVHYFTLFPYNLKLINTMSNFTWSSLINMVCAILNEKYGYTYYIESVHNIKIINLQDFIMELKQYTSVLKYVKICDDFLLDNIDCDIDNNRNIC